jgi:hypothetical protein
MLRRFNYTNRIKLRRSDVDVCVQMTPRGLEFDAKISFQDYDLPQDAVVFIEAYRQTNWMRFYFGRVGAIVPPQDRLLSQFDVPEGIQFRVKVTVQDGLHRLLAEADGIPLRQPGDEKSNRKPLLPVKPADLPNEIYRLDFQADSPILLISKQAGNYSDISQAPEFVSLTFPMILRQILTKVLVVDDFDDPTESNDWRGQWLRFAVALPAVSDPPNSEDAIETKIEWIDAAATAFAKHIKAQDRFQEHWSAS